MRRILLICLALMVLMPLPAMAVPRTWYVSPSGSNARTCAEAEGSGATMQSFAKQNIINALDCLRTLGGPGDSVMLWGGNTYSAARDMIDVTSFTLPTGNNTGWGSTYSGMVIIGCKSGSGTCTITPALDNLSAIRLNTSGTSYLQFQDITINMAANTVIGHDNGADGIYLSNGAHNNRFVRMEVKNNVTNCIQITPGSAVSSSNNHVVNSNLHDCGGGGSSMAPPANWDAYGIYNDSDDNLIEGNLIHDIGGVGVTAYGDRNIIRSNRIYDTGTYHYATNDTSFGVEICASAHPAGCADVLVYNNLIYRNRGGVIAYTGSSNTGIYNNTFYLNSGDGNGVEGLFYTTPPIVRNNILYQSGVICDGPPACTGTNITAQSHNLVGTNPSFHDAANGDFTLDPGSLGIDTGTLVAVVTVDFTGATRPMNGIYDRGAYESSGTVASDCTPPEVSGSFTLRACPGAYSTDGFSNAVTVGETTSSGDLGICVIVASTGVTFPTVEDSKSNIWTLFPGATKSMTQGTVKVYYSRLTSVGLSHTFTANTGGVTSYPAMKCVVFSGSNALPVDQAMAGAFTDSGTTMSPGPISLPKTKELVVVGAIMNDTGTMAVDSSFTTYQISEGLGNWGVMLAFRTYTSTGVTNPVVSWPITIDAASTGVAFLASDSVSLGSVLPLLGRTRLRIR